MFGEDETRANEARWITLQDSEDAVHGRAPAVVVGITRLHCRAAAIGCFLKNWRGEVPHAV